MINDNKILLKIKKYIREINFELGKDNFFELGEHQFSVSYKGNKVQVISRIIDSIECINDIVPNIIHVSFLKTPEDVKIYKNKNISFSSKPSIFEVAELQKQNALLTHCIIDELIKLRKNDIKELFFKFYKR